MVSVIFSRLVRREDLHILQPKLTGLHVIVYKSLVFDRNTGYHTTVSSDYDYRQIKKAQYFKNAMEHCKHSYDYDHTFPNKSILALLNL